MLLYLLQLLVRIHVVVDLNNELSGHIIFLENATTGDGQLSAAKLLSFYKKADKKMSELASVMTYYPQILVNVKIKPEWKNKLDTVKEITDCIAKNAEKLGDDGRILVRESGTEPLIRVMVEGKEQSEINRIAEEIADMVKKIMV